MTTFFFQLLIIMIKNILEEHLSAWQYIFLNEELFAIKLTTVFTVGFLTFIIVCGIFAFIEVKNKKDYTNKFKWITLAISITLTIFISALSLKHLAEKENFWTTKEIIKEELYLNMYLVKLDEVKNLEKIEKCFNLKQKIFAKDLKQCYNN